MKVYRHKIIARFGLMHMIGTNLSVWLSVLIQETKHEILTFYDPENRTLRISHRIGSLIILWNFTHFFFLFFHDFLSTLSSILFFQATNWVHMLANKLVSRWDTHCTP